MAREVQAKRLAGWVIDEAGQHRIQVTIKTADEGLVLATKFCLGEVEQKRSLEIFWRLYELDGFGAL